jgi:hypothetical protein
MLVHMVYFSLIDGSAKSRDALVAACKKHLADHPGTVHFSVGTLCAELTRPVNVRDFDVSLHLIFSDKAAHDRYQEHPRHLQFIEENKGNWKQVRVFDSLTE